jgi:hypothetical protein
MGMVLKNIKYMNGGCFENLSRKYRKSVGVKYIIHFEKKTRSTIREEAYTKCHTQETIVNKYFNRIYPSFKEYISASGCKEIPKSLDK